MARWNNRVVEPSSLDPRLIRAVNLVCSVWLAAAVLALVNVFGIPLLAQRRKP